MEQPAGLNFGPYPQQVNVAPSGRTVVVVDRGNKAERDKPEDPGALGPSASKMACFRIRGGAPNGGTGSAPATSIPSEKPWMYVSDEKRSQLHMFRMPGDRIEPEAAYPATRSPTARTRSAAAASTIHVIGGRFVYIANRADHTIDFNGQKVSAAVRTPLRSSRSTRRPVSPPIQYAATHSFHVRTFAFDPSGASWSVRACKSMNVREGADVKVVSRRVSVFRVGADGKLDFVRKYDVDAAGKTHYGWGS